MENFERRLQLKRRKLNEERKCAAASALLVLAAGQDACEGTETQNAAPTCVDPVPELIPDTSSSATGTPSQTEMTAADIRALITECENLRSENQELKSKLKTSSLESDSFKDNDDKVRYFTGLPSFAVMLVIFNFICPHMSLKSTLSAFQQFLLTCMRLRLNVSVQYLGYCFGVSTSTASRVFLNTINVMHARLVPLLVVWPDREVLRASMPLSFRSKFRKCACIIDCFEIFIERPGDLKARAQTYSTYKSHNTMKYLIGITPQGTISFISKGWGGRVSDKHVTEHCGFLQKISPGDLILADRGFDMGDTVGLYAANLKIPAFTKGKKQLSGVDVESTRGLASVRIHVERVIGLTRQKYTMLGTTIPITLLQADAGSCNALKPRKLLVKLICELIDCWVVKFCTLPSFIIIMQPRYVLFCYCRPWREVHVKPCHVHCFVMPRSYAG